MLSFSKSPAKPQSGNRSPSYPRALGIGALLFVAACGGTAIESTSEGNAGSTQVGGYGGEGPSGAAPYPIDAAVPETQGAGGMVGTGGTGGAAGSIGGGAPLPYEDSGVGGSAGSYGGSGGGIPTGDIAEPYDAGPDAEPSPDGFAPEPYDSGSCPGAGGSPNP